ncbi:MAG: DNA repair protein RadA [Endomicrobium sp.]|jgi:DNA repair protein RadA/Sms|nr:DNA repair protein RadA [Endomicrobium sp.]
MKIKMKFKFLCQSCGYESIQWLGRCPACRLWNSFKQEKLPNNSKKNLASKDSADIFKLKDIFIKNFSRYKTGIKEFDNMIGGGIVPGSFIFLGGQPGIGKTTLMLHMSNALSDNGVVLYISGEESLSQIKFHAERLKVVKDNIFLAAETNIKNIMGAVDRICPKFLIIDSIQTIYNPEISSIPGTVTQIKESASEFLKLAKSKNVVVFLLGHITKDGDLAGPKVLEHMVDTVLYFESERQHTYRILRAYKNRFGPTSEIGIFKMDSSGFSEILNPSLVFLEERVTNIAGSIVTVSMEGIRPILIEVQALTSRTAFGIPRKMVLGYDVNRVTIIIAVLEKTLDFSLEMQNIFINIASGIKIRETSIDLAVACAIASANLKFICPKDVIVFGEIGLAGEIRSVSFSSERLLEAEKLGFKKAIIPKGNFKNLSYKGTMDVLSSETLETSIKFLKNETY